LPSPLALPALSPEPASPAAPYLTFQPLFFSMRAIKGWG
jgi:hypothetical protein